MPQASAPVALNAEAPAVNPPQAAPPPPVAQSAAAPGSEAEAAAQDAKVDFKDLDGKTISVVEWLEQMIQGYERLRASDVENVRPPIQRLEDLVNLRVITRLPAAPAGRKYAYDPHTGKVSVVSQ